MIDSTAKAKDQMEKAIVHLKAEFSKLRVGRASVGMVEGVMVDAYGGAMGIKEVAAITTPDAKTIAIQPWDMSLIAHIERGILAANLGLTPINDGKLVRINLPAMTEERRKDFVKQIKKMGEDAKVGIRTIRRDAIDGIKKANKDSSEDESRRIQDDVQKLTDKFVAEVDHLVEAKSKEVMTI